MDYRTVGLVAGYQGRPPASGRLPQNLREFAGITRSGAPHPGSVGISIKWRIKSYVFLQAWRGPAPRFFDSVGKSKH